MGTTAVIGNYRVETKWGVPQGGVLSPVLFNVYLEEALKSKQNLWKAALKGHLVAYADDMVICTSSEEELKVMISELEQLDTLWGIKMNLNKSEILSGGASNRPEDIAGVRRVQEVKYLGVVIARDDKEMVNKNRAAVGKYLSFIKGKMRSASLDVKAALMQAYVKSLIVYFGTPLLAAGKVKD